MDVGWAQPEQMTPAVGWDPRVGLIVSDWFQSSIGTRLLRVVAGAFERFGLELDSSAGASWFYDVDGSSVSELKWKIWTMAIAHVLRVPIPENFLHLFIAVDYFMRQRGRSNQQRYGDRKLLPFVLPCHYAVLKLEELKERDIQTPATDAMSSEEGITHLVSLMSRVPCTFSTRTCLLDAMRLFDVSEQLCVLFFAWLQLQVQVNKQPLEWLDAFLAQAKAGGGGHLGNVLLFFLDTVHACRFKGFYLLPRENIDRVFNVCIKELPMVEWQSIDLTPGVRQVLEEVDAEVTHKFEWDKSLLLPLERWVHRRSLVYQHRPREIPYVMDFTDASLQIGRLIYTWTLTKKGQRDHAELQTLCSTGKSIVEHAQSVPVGSSDERQLYRAAAAVFGKDLSGHFVQLCRNAQWEPDGVPCSQSELGEIRELAWRGLILIFKFQSRVPEHYFDGGPKQLRNKVPFGAMIVYIVHVIFEDHLALDIDCKTWTEECHMALNSHPNRATVRNKSGIFVASDGTRKRCLALEKLIESPKIQRALGASADEIRDAMVKAFAAGGIYFDQEHRNLWFKMGKIFRGDYARLSAYIIAYVIFKGLI
ncbi:uncharacterized protein LOC112349961 [Selaginella moellendorffii]|uniref:uncharacterized protein LOC112349961 n=1 Tax=Selaginella moellendorffii TaxID=88036 RepID=UPI000D1CD846|nr:uncharacterized protein LOC112349961 [Selaginella moellendorffii]|eukprot:XP_024541035.1 uncharacterized protein LOC112349961 [Selaginella moellendorffii]